MKNTTFLTSLTLIATAAFAAPELRGTPIHGKVSGFASLPTDDVIDGAIVVPSIRSEQLLSLQIDSLISPNEPMEAGPIKANIPGNLFIPSQVERYSMFSINLNKESFTYYATPGLNDELAALSFKGGFSKMVDMIQNKEPLTHLMGLVKLQKLGFASDRDWTRTPNVQLGLDQTSTKMLSYRWNHSGPSRDAQDMIVSFQRTPADRWMIADFSGAPAASGTLGSFSIFKPEMKTMFLRVWDPAPTDKRDNVPATILGYIRASQNQGTIQADGLPPTITGLNAQETRLIWNPINQAGGWMAVLRQPPRGFDSRADLFETPFSDMAPFASDATKFFFGPINIDTPRIPTHIDGWANPASGSYDLKAPLGADKLYVIYIGTDRVVPSPEGNAPGTEPELFTYASEVRFVRVP